GIPEVMILSNIVENGKPIGLADAGQDWHTDMSYSSTIALANVLYGIKIPRRGGKPLGATEFANMHAAYDGLPAEMKRDLEGMTVLHDFNKFWEMMRRDKGSRRPPLSEAQKKAKPPVSHPIFLTHPITRRKVLYANPGYSIRINELPQKESDEMLEFLFEHRPGANAIIATEAVARSAPDGYTLLFSSLSLLVNAILLEGKVHYDPFKDFAPVSNAAVLPMVVVTSPETRINSMQDLIALAR